MIIHADKLPPTLTSKRDVLIECLRAFERVLPIETVILFGSQSRGTPHADSDVDLCIVVRAFTSQREAGHALRRAISDIRGKPPLSLIPITSDRLAEKQQRRDPFFETVLQEGIVLASHN